MTYEHDHLKMYVAMSAEIWITQTCRWFASLLAAEDGTRSKLHNVQQNISTDEQPVKRADRQS